MSVYFRQLSLFAEQNKHKRFVPEPINCFNSKLSRNYVHCTTSACYYRRRYLQRFFSPNVYTYDMNSKNCAYYVSYTRNVRVRVFGYFQGKRFKRFGAHELYTSYIVKMTAKRTIYETMCYSILARTPEKRDAKQKETHDTVHGVIHRRRARM